MAEKLIGIPNEEQKEAIKRMIAMHKGGMISTEVTVEMKDKEPVIAYYK